jgi:hypothetical protein
MAAVVTYVAFSGPGNSTTATTASVVEPRPDVPAASLIFDPWEREISDWTRDVLGGMESSGWSEAALRPT